MDNVKYGFSDLEPLRKKVVFLSNLLIKGALVFFISLWVVVFPLLLLESYAAGFVTIFLFAAITAIAIISTKMSVEARKQYMLAYKEALVIPALASKFDHYTYSPDGKVTTHDISELGIWNTSHGHLESRTEDLLTGTYKGVYYEQVDARVWIQLSQRNSIFAFNGTISKFRFNKTISGKLVIASSISSMAFSINEMPSIKTENEEFNKRFTVYSKEGHDAFYVLTPHFMECIQKLYETIPYNRHELRRLIIAFEDNTMTILRNGVRMFELSEAKKVDFFEEREKITNEMKEMLDIVDILNIGNAEKEPPNNAFQGEEAGNKEIQNNDGRPVAKFRLK